MASARAAVLLVARKADALRLSAARTTWAARAELLHAGSIVLGWTLVTWGVAAYFGIWQVWPFSGGLFLLSLAGWGHLRALFGKGLYTLSRDED